jgi:hypothetical protein
MYRLLFSAQKSNNSLLFKRRTSQKETLDNLIHRRIFESPKGGQ